MESLAVRALKYGYLNARVKAMKSALLSRRDFKEMLMLDVPGIIGILARSDYQEDLRTLSIRHSGETLIEKTVEANFERKVNHIASLGSSIPEIPLLVKKYRTDLFFEERTPETFHELSSQLLRINDAHLLAFLREEIALTELLFILRAKEKNIDVSSFSFHFFTPEDLTRAPQELLSRFPAIYRRWKDASDRSLLALEILIERHLAHRATRELHRRVLSLSAIAGYLCLKTEEIRNVRKIVRGKQFGMPLPTIEASLVIP